MNFAASFQALFFAATFAALLFTSRAPADTGNSFDQSSLALVCVSATEKSAIDLNALGSARLRIARLESKEIECTYRLENLFTPKGNRAPHYLLFLRLVKCSSESVPVGVPDPLSLRVPVPSFEQGRQSTGTWESQLCEITKANPRVLRMLERRFNIQATGN